VRITCGKPISGHTLSLMHTTPLLGAGLVGFVGSSDLPRSRAFYEAVLGLAVVDDNAYACVFDVAGTTLRITAVPEAVVAPYAVLGWQVDDIDTTVRGLRGRGVTFTFYPGMDQDDRGIWTAPGGGRIAWFFDPDGHTLSLTQPPGLTKARIWSTRPLQKRARTSATCRSQPPGPLRGQPALPCHHSAERIPHPCQASVSTTRPIRPTSRPVAACRTPHTRLFPPPAAPPPLPFRRLSRSHLRHLSPLHCTKHTFAIQQNYH